MYVSRGGRVTNRRHSAYSTPAMTRTATTFWSPVTNAHSAPFERPRDDRLHQPAGHRVGRADRQDHEAPEDRVVHERDLRVAEHPDLGEDVDDHRPEALRDLSQRIRARRVRCREDPQVAVHRQGEEDGGAPEQREDEWPPGDPGDLLRHRAGTMDPVRRTAGTVTGRSRRPSGRPRGRGRTARRASPGRAAGPARPLPATRARPWGCPAG